MDLGAQPGRQQYVDAVLAEGPEEGRINMEGFLV
jgi:hypothetical protein